MIFLVFFSTAYVITQCWFPSKRSFLVFCGTLSVFTEGRLLLLALGLVVGILFIKESYLYLWRPE